MLVLKAGLSLAMPAVAIVLAALVQLALTSLWPQVQRIHFPVASVDSYAAVLLAGALCFAAGRFLQRFVRNGYGAACATLVPIGWLAMVLWGTLRFSNSVHWSEPLTLFILATGLTPLTGVLAGWGLSAMRDERRASA